MLAARRQALDSPASGTSFSVGVRGIPVPAEVITVAVRCYLRLGLSYRNVEELLAERGAILTPRSLEASVGRPSIYSGRTRRTAEPPWTPSLLISVYLGSR